MEFTAFMSVATLHDYVSLFREQPQVSTYSRD